jgi:hypothetical protein
MSTPHTPFIPYIIRIGETRKIKNTLEDGKAALNLKWESAEMSTVHSKFLMKPD